MSKSYRPFEPKQKYLLPPSPEEWLPEGHLAYFVQDVVAALDLRPFLAYYERDHRGAPPHHPAMMVGLLLYAYCVGVTSSRKIERKTYGGCERCYQAIPKARLRALPFARLCVACKSGGLSRR